MIVYVGPDLKLSRAGTQQSVLLPASNQEVFILCVR